MFVLTVDQRHSRRGQRPGRCAARLARRTSRACCAVSSAPPETRCKASWTTPPRSSTSCSGSCAAASGASASAPDRCTSRCRRALAPARGAAFELARKAVERAKSSPQLLAVEAPDAARAAAAQAALDLLASVVQRRTEPGWEAVDLISSGHHPDRGRRTRSASPSRRCRSGCAPPPGHPRWPGADLAAQLLAAADGPDSGSAAREGPTVTILALVLLLLAALAPLLVLALRRVDATRRSRSLCWPRCCSQLAAIVAAYADPADGWRRGAALVLGVAAATTAGSDVVRATFRLIRGEFLPPRRRRRHDCKRPVQLPDHAAGRVAALQTHFGRDVRQRPANRPPGEATAAAMRRVPPGSWPRGCARRSRSAP